MICHPFSQKKCYERNFHLECIMVISVAHKIEHEKYLLYVGSDQALGTTKEVRLHVGHPNIALQGPHCLHGLLTADVNPKQVGNMKERVVCCW